jgi:hypothetical protein
LAGRWTHSFEEDHDGITVYRRADFTFPPARGRRGVEFRPDGTFVQLDFGRGDAPEPGASGRWSSAGALSLPPPPIAGSAGTGGTPGGEGMNSGADAAGMNSTGSAGTGGMPGGAGMNGGAAATGSTGAGGAPAAGVAGRVVRAAPDRLEIVWE